MKKNRVAKSAFHGVGIGALVAAVFLQFLVFWTIYTQGFFHATEPNAFILKTELLLASFAGVYVVVIFRNMVKKK